FEKVLKEFQRLLSRRCAQRLCRQCPEPRPLETLPKPFAAATIPTSCKQDVASYFSTNRNPLVHPARLRSAIPLAHIVIRRNVIPMLIEVHFPVVATHVDFKLFGRTPALPAVIGVTQAEVSLRKAEQQPPAGNQSYVEEAE